MVRSLMIVLMMLYSVTSVAADDGQKLIAAVSSGQVSKVHMLLDKGVDPNSKNQAGRPVSVIAAVKGNDRSIRALMASGADVNAVDGLGITALMAASSHGHQDIATILIVSGADVNLKDANGKTALAKAVLAGHSVLAEKLKSAGAVEEKEPELDADGNPIEPAEEEKK